MQTRTSKGGPDQGWAWMIVVACFTINAIMAGVARASGILYVALIDLYGVSRESATTPFSTRSCVRNLTGPIIGLLGQRYGIRPVTTIGSIIAAVGGILCFAAPNVFWITIFWGVIYGIGSALSTVLHMMLIHQYFEKYKASAMGLGYSGNCVGSLVFPVLLEILIDTYGVRGTFLILGGIALNILPLALLLKTPPWIEENTKSTSKDQVSDEKTDNGNMSALRENTTEGVIFNQRKVLGYPYSMSDIYRGLPVQLIHLTKRRHSFSSTRIEHDKESSYKKRTINICQKWHDKKHESQQETETPCRMYVVESHHTIIEPPLTTSYTNKGFASSSPSIHQAGVRDDVSSKDCRLCDSRSVPAPKSCQSPNGSVSSYMSSLSPRTTSQSDGNAKVSNVLAAVVSVVTSPMFNLISMTMAVYAFLFVTIMTIIIDYGVDKGISQQEGKYLLIGFSAADLVGRLSFGRIMDKKLVPLHCYVIITVTAMGGLVASIPWYPNFPSLMAVVVSYGFIQGGTAIMFPILIGNYMNREKENIAMGCMNFYAGLIMFGMAPMIGFFRDQYGSYDGIFYIIGGMGALTGCLWLLEPFAISCKNKAFQAEESAVTSGTVSSSDKI